MTLYRQLIILSIAIILLLFTTTYLAKLHNTRSFLEQQLKSHAMDTATSLGLAITPYVAENDTATVETMVNAIFDHGSYRVIELTDLQENIILERTLDVVVQDVPAWFIRLVPLQLPQAESLITSGWTQVGFLRVECHPGYAYKSLWKIAVDMARIFLAVGVLIAVLGAIGLHLLLRPLRKVEEQADALCNREYTFQEQLPKTRELRRVVVAMNSMTGKVKQMFDDHVQTADQLRQSAYTDPLTGLGNRRFLENAARAEMQQEKGVPNGAFLLLEIHDLQEMNKVFGYEFGDELLVKVAGILKKMGAGFENSGMARLSGGGFAALLPNAKKEEAEQAAETLSRGLRDLVLAEDELDGRNIGNIGCVCYSQSTQLGALLAAADRLLRGAQSEGNNSWQLEAFSESPHAPQGETAWREMLEDALDNRKFLLFGQLVAVRVDPLEPMYLEVFSRIPMEDGLLHSAGVFIPLAERIGNIAEIDRAMLEKIFALDPGVLPTRNLAVNLSVATLKDELFLSWLAGELQQRQGGPRIIFEFAEYGLARDLPSILAFAQTVRPLGCELGIDHFGKGFINFGYLQSLRPEYVKIDRAFTTDVGADNSDCQFFISSLASVARSLDIRVIVEGVESQNQFNRLAAMNVDGFQGFYIDSPHEIGAG